MSIWHRIVGTAFAGLCLSGLYAQNLVVNGSFEDTPPLTRRGNGHDWDVFPSIPGWTLSYGPAIEVMGHVPGGWDAADGSQWLELDADTIPPTYQQGQIGIYQDIQTTPGAVYTLSFAFSPRPAPRRDPGEIDGIRVYWGGNLVATLFADGNNLSNTQWTYYTFTVTATASTTRLEFQDASQYNNTYGALLDDVSVQLVPEPATLVALGTGLAGLLIRRRRF